MYLKAAMGRRYLLLTATGSRSGKDIAFAINRLESII
jgi:hypothetical protein